MNYPLSMPDKMKVARSFGRAAPDYDRFARLQRDVADTLLALDLPETAEDILDLGSGTGYCTRLLGSRYPQSAIASLDLSEGMLRHSMAHEVLDGAGGSGYVCGDAEVLPFRKESFDLVVSSLTIQWCQTPEKVFAELYRVMKPGARALVSTLVEGTLQELKASWQQVDGYVHVNRFLGLTDLIAALGEIPFSSCDWHNSREIYFYESLSALTRELKGIGANNHNDGQARGLTGRKKLQILKQTFEAQYQAGKGIPVTYDLVLIELEKQAS